ncbi:hypothetical protein LCGC14_2948380 [marine sediment metagenome]|uniref:Phage minor structural protein GP20 n=1 Tax=marine sediment metagenome TaxID=412755 RepID=A0A0F9A767_9ZZZZ
MDDIKKLLGDEIFESVKAKLNGEILTLVPKGQKVFLHKENETPVINNNGEWFPKQKFNDVNEALKAEKLLTANTIKELETLKKSAGSNVELQTTIDKMKETAEKSKTDNDLRFSNLTKTGLVKEALVDLGATRPNAGLLLNEIQLSKVVVGDDGKISNAEDLFKTVLTDHKSLFGKPILKGKDPIIPAGAPEGYITKDKFLAMTPQERTANIAKVNESSPHWDKK